MKPQDVSEALSPVCTSVCTSNSENDNADTLDTDPLSKLAASLLTLSPGDRERLAALLIGHQGNNPSKALEGGLK